MRLDKYRADPARDAQRLAELKAQEYLFSVWLTLDYQLDLARKVFRKEERFDKVVIDKKVEYFGEAKNGDAWLNIQYPEFKATLYLSHTSISNGQFSLDTLVMDAYKFANNHNSMASSIEDSTFSLGNHMGGAFFHIGGDVATAYQFYLTDSTRHFIRGALYFDATPNQDSLAPVNAFLLEDIKHMVQHFHWK